MSQIYSNYYSSFFLGKRNFSEKLYDYERKRIEALLKPYLPESRAIRILEIGCGVGFVLNYLKSAGYENHYGIDISAGAIGLCHKNVTPNAEAISTLDYLPRIQGTV